MFVLPENLRSTSISTLISSNSSYRCTSTRVQPSWSMRGKKGVTSRARGNQTTIVVDFFAHKLLRAVNRTECQCCKEVHGVGVWE